jgi:hypothetical protein
MPSSGIGKQEDSDQGKPPILKKNKDKKLKVGRFFTGLTGKISTNPG